MRGRSSGKTGPPVPGLTRVGGGANKAHLRKKSKDYTLANYGGK